LTRRWVPHDTRDSIVDFVRIWSDKTDIPVCRFLPWIDIGTSKFHDWKQRFGKVNEHNAWVPRDHWLTDDEKDKICVFARQHPLEGYRRLTFMMLDADQVACSPASVYRVLKGAGLLAGASPNITKKGTGFVQPLKAHEHWHIDISYLNIAGTFYFLCSIIDGYSRFIVHWEIREKMEESDVQTILQRAREAYPDARPRIISDNGPQFIAKDFKEFIRIAGMTHVKTSPYYPQSNGKLERWHKTLKGECIRVQVPLSLDDARHLVADYVAHYNNVRLHSAIGYITPSDKLAGRDKEISDNRDRKLAVARERRKQQRQAEHERSQVQPTVATRPAIDFIAVRAAITLAAVLQLLGFKANSARGGQQRGPCPLHGSTSGTSRCFSANLDDHVFHCFKCGCRGNALDLWAKAKNMTIYDAAIDLCQRLGIPLPTLPDPTRNREEEPVAPDGKNSTMSSAST
jgi:putative transposase